MCLLFIIKLSLHEIKKRCCLTHCIQIEFKRRKILYLSRKSIWRQFLSIFQMPFGGHSWFCHLVLRQQQRRWFLEKQQKGMTTMWYLQHRKQHIAPPSAKLQGVRYHWWITIGPPLLAPLRRCIKTLEDLQNQVFSWNRYSRSTRSQDEQLQRSKLNLLRRTFIFNHYSLRMAERNSQQLRRKQTSLETAKRVYGFYLNIYKLQCLLHVTGTFF